MLSENDVAWRRYHNNLQPSPTSHPNPLATPWRHDLSDGPMAAPCSSVWQAAVNAATRRRGDLTPERIAFRRRRLHGYGYVGRWGRGVEREGVLLRTSAKGQPRSRPRGRRPWTTLDHIAAAGSHAGQLGRAVGVSPWQAEA